MENVTLKLCPLEARYLLGLRGAAATLADLDLMNELAAALKPTSHQGADCRKRLEDSEDALGPEFEEDLAVMMAAVFPVEISTVGAQKLKEMFLATGKHPIHYAPMILRLRATLEAVGAVADDPGE